MVFDGFWCIVPDRILEVSYPLWLRFLIVKILKKRCNFTVVPLGFWSWVCGHEECTVMATVQTRWRSWWRPNPSFINIDNIDNFSWSSMSAQQVSAGWQTFFKIGLNIVSEQALMHCLAVLSAKTSLCWMFGMTLVNWLSLETFIFFPQTETILLTGLGCSVDDVR